MKLSTQHLSNAQRVVCIALKEADEPLTMLELARKVSIETGIPKLPSDFCDAFNTLEGLEVIKRVGSKKNPLLMGKRTARMATTYQLTGS